VNLVEETTNTCKLNTFTRFDTDITDLLRVHPQNGLGRKYWYDMNKEQVNPIYVPPKMPAGVPAWTFLQVHDLGYLKYIVD
jgi:ubiquinone biosynthesis protein Coq4